MRFAFKLFFAILVACVPVQTRHASAQNLGGRSTSHLDGGPEALDRFGVREIYPTAPDGRQWYLPDSPSEFDAQWIPENRNIVSLSPGRYHTEGQVRLSVGSPAGAHWWRDVEMTAYLLDTGPLPDPSQKPHWELFARGERHTHRPVLGSEV